MGRSQQQQHQHVTFRRVAVIGAGLLALGAAGCGGSGSLALGGATTTTTTVAGHSTAAHQSIPLPPSSVVSSSAPAAVTTVPPTTTLPPTTTVPPTTAATVPPTTVPPTTIPPTTSAVLPTVDIDPVDADYQPEVKPSTIYLSGDATDVVTKLFWAGWDGHGATGYGTVDILSCNPSCATGSATPTPVTIYLNDPVGGAFSLLTENIQGMPSRNFPVPTS